MKILVKIILILIIVITVILLISERVILVSVAKNGLKYVVGLKTQMNKIALQPLKGSIAIKGLQIYNPPGYTVKVLADVPLILMDSSS